MFQKKKGEKKVVVLAWVASLMCCVWCAIMCEDVRVSSGHLSGFKSATPPNSYQTFPPYTTLLQYDVALKPTNTSYSISPSCLIRGLYYEDSWY